MLYGASPSEVERLRVLDRVFELGCRFWDTAGKFCSLREIHSWWWR